MADFTGNPWTVIETSKSADSASHTPFSLVLTSEYPFYGISVPTSYVQRVYSSGLSAYTKTSIDPTPLTTDTTPNWTGSITAHQVLAVI